MRTQIISDQAIETEPMLLQQTEHANVQTQIQSRRSRREKVPTNHRRLRHRANERGGRDAFHRVPDLLFLSTDGVESVPTVPWQKRWVSGTWNRLGSISTLLTVCLCLLLLGIQTLATTVTWDGGGNGSSWHDRNNWNWNQLPGPGDDVVIWGNVTVHVTNGVVISGLVLTNTARLQVDNGVFQANGPTVLNGADLLAYSGGQIKMLSSVNYVAGSSGGDRLIHAEGAGSLITMPGLTSLEGHVGDHTLNVRALAGAEIMLGSNGSSVMTNGTVAILAQQGGKIIWPSLTKFAAGSATYDRLIQAEGAGSLISMPGLTSLEGHVGIHTLNVRAMAGGQIVMGSSEAMVVPNGAIYFSADGTGSKIRSPSLRELRGSPSITAKNQGVVQLSLLKEFAAGSASYDGLIQAEGAGSQISMPGLTSLEGHVGDHTLNVQASWGAEIQLGSSGPSVMTNGTVAILAQLGGKIIWPSLTEFAAGSATYDRLIQAEGPGSLISMPGLTRLEGHVGNHTLNVRALAGAEIMLGSNSSSVMTNGTVAILAQQGGKIIWPSLTKFAAGSVTYDRLIQAEGSGSLISMPGLTSLEGHVGVHALNVRAIAGGRINIHALPQITNGWVSFLSDGRGSLEDLSSLMLYSSPQGGSFEARNEGIILLPIGARSTNATVKNITYGPMVPRLLSSPIGSSNIVGTAVAFALDTVGSLPINYQWFHNGASVSDDPWYSGSSSERLIIRNTLSSHSGVYSVTVSNLAGILAPAPVANLNLVPLFSRLEDADIGDQIYSKLLPFVVNPILDERGSNGGCVMNGGGSGIGEGQDGFHFIFQKRSEI
jgi:hypothetical protein